MCTDSMFRSKYQMLESLMKAQAETDGKIFLPNLAPSSPVDYVFVCMEPSLGRWGPTHEVAVERIDAGFRNFMYSLEDFIFHYCANQYLCSRDQRYFVTDVSKGAMLVNHAVATRAERYNRWHSLLLDELDLLLRPDGRVIAVGKEVAIHFKNRRFPVFSTILHYSNQAAQSRNAQIVGREEEFEAYRGTVLLEDVLNNAEEVMLTSGIPVAILNETLARLSTSELTESRRKLMFIYKTAFEAFDTAV